MDWTFDHAISSQRNFPRNPQLLCWLTYIDGHGPRAFTPAELFHNFQFIFNEIISKAGITSMVNTWNLLVANQNTTTSKLRTGFDLSDIARRYSVISIIEHSCLVLVLPTAVKVSNRVQKLSNEEEAAAVSDARIWTKCTVGKLQRDTTFRDA
jgi:hypothetical protein